MNTNEAKQIRIEEYLHTLGYNPVRRQVDSLWYLSLIHISLIRTLHLFFFELLHIDLEKYYILP